MKKILKCITAFLTNFYIWNTTFWDYFSPKTHCLHNTKYNENNAFYIFNETILSFDFGCPYVHPDGKFRPRVFKLIYMDYITFGESHSD